MKLLTLSLKTKMTIGVCLVVAGIIAALGIYSLSYFQQQLRENVSAQQFALISSIAGNIDDNLLVTQDELVEIAKNVPLDILQDAGRAQSFLDNRGRAENRFDNGIFLFAADGTLIAETPFVAGRRGNNYSFRDYFKKTIASAKPTISAPYFSSKQHRKPVVVLTAPLLNAAGEVVGVLAGGIDLTHHNFLGKLAHVPIGKSGYLYLFNTDRTMILHPDEKRILTKDVPPGVNKGFDKAAAGFDGTMETVNSNGTPVLATFRHLTATNWILAANFPQSEAYAAIDRTRRHLVTSLLAAVVLSAGVIWFYMKRLTMPLLRFTSHVRSFTGKGGAERFFADNSGDEISVLAEAFNGMVKELDNEREAVNRGQKALMESEERFRQIAEYSHEVIILVSSDLSTMIYVNPAYEMLWQRSCQSLYENPRSYTDGIHEADQSRILTALEQLLQGGTFDQTYRIVRTDLTVCWVRGRTYPVRDENGEIYRYVGIAEDVTQKMLAEEQIRKLQQAVEQSPVSIVITDCAGNIEYVNPRFTQLTGYSYLESVGQNPRILKSGEMSDNSYRQMWEKITAGGEWNGEVLNRKKNGELFWESSSISAIKSSAGEITHYLGIKEDITERKHAELLVLESTNKYISQNNELLATEEMLRVQINEFEALQILLQKAKTEAESANCSKSEFLANMSHEIRTPMNGVIGMTELLKMTDLTEVQLEYVEALDESGNNLLDLINNILDLSKVESGMIEIESAEFSLIKCINDIFLTQKSVAYEKGLALDVNVATDIPRVLVGDQLRVKQILLNLLSNAVKFTVQGHITLSAHLIEQHDAFVFVRIAVRDTGIGISAGVLDKIFMPFVQENSSTTRIYGGTGLGLSISRRLAELMEGSISVESTPDVGSCFSVILPFFIARMDATENDTNEKKTVSWDGPALRILFVEDNPTNLKVGTTLLSKLGHDVVSAENGVECLVALKNGTFELVLLDIQMPVMNGNGALREIRRQEQGTNLHQPVIALTAFSLHGDKERFLQEGFDGYVSKPFKANELIYEMKRVVENFKSNTITNERDGFHEMSNSRG